MYLKREVLDHGYVRLIETWGHGDSDIREAAIIEAARMSTNKGFEGWEKDEKLLAYLYNNKHMTPFEMAGMTIEVCAPIFVFREWHRHRTQSYNELSARYVPMPNENYVPDFVNLIQRARAQTKNKQEGGITMGDFATPDSSFRRWQEELEKCYERAQEVYQMGLDMGVPKELARLSVPVARYSRMRASGNLRNWLAFLTLRMDLKAQWEIRQYANVVGLIVREFFPRTWKLFFHE